MRAEMSGVTVCGPKLQLRHDGIHTEINSSSYLSPRNRNPPEECTHCVSFAWLHMLKALATHSMWAIPPKVVSVSSMYILHAWGSYPVKIFSWPPRTAIDFEYLNLASYVKLQTSRDMPRSRSSQRPWHGIARDFGALTRDRVLVEVFFCHFLPIWKCNAESTGRHTVQTGQTFKTYVHLYRFCKCYNITCSTLSSLLDHKNESKHKAGSKFGKNY